MFVKYEIPEILRDKNWVFITDAPKNKEELKTHLFRRGTTCKEFSIKDIDELLESVECYETILENLFKISFKGEEFLILFGHVS